MYTGTRLIFLLIIISLFSCRNDAYRYPPGITLHTDSELSETLFAKVQGREHPVRIGIYLPENYAAEKDFPLVLWLNGGDGGPGNNVRIPRSVTVEKDFICVNFPLFKASLDSVNADSSNYWSRMALTHKESDIIWEQYRVMLEKLYEVIPNIDTNNTFMGGFSNGAHTTSILLSREKTEIKAYFENFYIIEGGGHLKDPSVLENHNFLVMIGGDMKRENTGHAFPVEFHQVLREWMVKCRR